VDESSTQAGYGFLVAVIENMSAGWSDKELEKTENIFRMTLYFKREIPVYKLCMD
jgi:hypothetical protein